MTTTEPNNYALIPRISFHELKGHELVLYATYADIAGELGNPVQQRNKVLASRVGCTIKTLKQHRNMLCKKGYIKLFYRDLGGEIQEITQIDAIETSEPLIVYLVDTVEANQKYVDMGEPLGITFKMLLEDTNNGNLLNHLRELLAKEPEPKNEPRPGYIYLLQGVGVYKIGRTKSPKRRYSTLSVKLPFDVKIVHLIKTNDMASAEKYLHDKYQQKRVRGEWFKLSDSDIKETRQIESMVVSDD